MRAHDSIPLEQMFCPCSTKVKAHLQIRLLQDGALLAKKLLKNFLPWRTKMNLDSKCSSREAFLACCAWFVRSTHLLMLKLSSAAGRLLFTHEYSHMSPLSTQAIHAGGIVAGDLTAQVDALNETILLCFADTLSPTRARACTRTHMHTAHGVGGGLFRLCTRGCGTCWTGRTRRRGSLRRSAR